MTTAAYRKGQRAAREWMKQGAYGSKPVCPYNGPALSDEWQAGFKAAQAARRRAIGVWVPES